jgi:hypothetical protein
VPAGGADQCLGDVGGQAVEDGGGGDEAEGETRQASGFRFATTAIARKLLILAYSM